MYMWIVNSVVARLYLRVSPLPLDASWPKYWDPCADRWQSCVCLRTKNVNLCCVNSSENVTWRSIVFNEEIWIVMSVICSSYTDCVVCVYVVYMCNSVYWLLFVGRFFILYIPTIRSITQLSASSFFFISQWRKVMTQDWAWLANLNNQSPSAALLCSSATWFMPQSRAVSA